MQVNELAKQSGVPAHVIRFYTQLGFLNPERNPKNGYRNYPPSDVYRVRFVRRAKWLGFTLKDIKEILAEADSGASPCPEVRQLIKLRARENHERVQDLLSLQSRVEQVVAEWESMPDRLPSHQSLCHLIDSVANAEGALT